MRTLLLPILSQLRGYRRNDAIDDLMAGSITAILLVPQAIAYALLAGLPAHYGLYASVVPVAVYALTGSSRTLSVGPVAVAALMVNEALGHYAQGDPVAQVQGAAILSLLVGVLLLLMSAIRGGAVVRFISRPVLAGFISGAALLIVLSQLLTLLGIAKTGGVWQSLGAVTGLQSLHLPTAILGITLVFLLVLARSPLDKLLRSFGFAPRMAQIVSRLVPASLTVVSGVLIYYYGQAQLEGVKTVGELPAGIFSGVLVFPQLAAVKSLLLPAVMIATIAYVESISIAKVLAARRSERILPDTEMRALGFANIASSLVGSMPVAGGFSRSVVNFDAGARTQVAALITAGLVAIASFLLSDLFVWLPNVVLAAIIIVAVWQLIEWHELVQLWGSARVDALCFIATAIGVLFLGVEGGLLVGVVLSMAHFLIVSSKPHIAIVGRVGRTEHFRNINRHQVQTKQGLLMIRVDENLVFTNAEAVEEFILKVTFDTQGVNKVVLVMSSVSRVDATATHMLCALFKALEQAGIELTFAEIKGPVQDTMKRCSEMSALGYQVYLSANEAFEMYIEPQAYCDPMPQC